MALTVKLLDFSTGAVLLDIVGGSTWRLGEGFSAPTPPLKRQILDSALRDGGSIPASAYGLRTINLPLVLPTDIAGREAGTSTARRDAITTLSRILNRDRFVLQVADSYGTARRFRCYRATDAVQILGRLTTDTTAEVTLQIVADPFAYGDKVVLSAITTTVAGRFVATIPAASIVGDVPAPLIPSFSWAAPPSDSVVVLGARTGVMSHDPISDSAGFFSVAASTSPANASALGGTVLSVALSAAASTIYNLSALTLRSGQTDRTALPGTYRVFMVYGFSAGADGQQASIQTVDTVPSKIVTKAGTGLKVLDLGLFDYPWGSSQANLPMEAPLGIEDQLLSMVVTVNPGSATFLLDALLFVPADESLLIWRTSSINANTYTEYIDPYTGQLLILSTSTGRATSYGGTTAPSYLGSVPMLTPGQDCNLVGFCATGSALDFTAANAPMTLGGHYFPQYLAPF